MVKNKMVNRFVSLLCVLFLLASSVLVPYQTAYASVSITEAGSYFLRMLCSAAGIYFEHSEVGLVVDVLSQVAAQSDTINSKEFQERMDYVLSLSPADRVDATFSNAFLADLINGFRESTINEDGHGGGGIVFNPPVSFEPHYSYTGSILESYGGYTDAFTVFYYSGKVKYYADIYIASSPTCFYKNKFDESNRYYLLVPYNGRDCKMQAVNGNDEIVSGWSFGVDESCVESLPYPVFENVSYAKNYVDTGVKEGLLSPGRFTASVSANRVWIDAFDDAALHAPAITAPITIPADTVAMEENAKAVAAANNADALYKALAGAGIAVDVTIPDETDKPTDAEIPDEGTSTIGKSLSDILAAITGMADKIGAIPARIENFFTIDTDAIGDAFMGLKGAFSSRFDALLKITNMFTNLSPRLDSAIPLISIRVPPSLQPIYNAEEVVVFDLRGYESTCSLIRLFFRALLWFGFGYVVLREFDVKFHVS